MVETAIEDEEFPKDVFFCDYCGKSFTDNEDKARHMFEEHDDIPFSDKSDG